MEGWGISNVTKLHSTPLYGGATIHQQWANISEMGPDVREQATNNWMKETSERKQKKKANLMKVVPKV